MQPVKSQRDYPDRVRIRVRVALIEAGKSARGLAAEIGWSQSYMAKRMSGRHPFDVADLTRIADALGIEPNVLTADRDRVAA